MEDGVIDDRSAAIYLRGVATLTHVETVIKILVANMRKIYADQEKLTTA